MLSSAFDGVCVGASGIITVIAPDAEPDVLERFLKGIYKNDEDSTELSEHCLDLLGQFGFTETPSLLGDDTNLKEELEDFDDPDINYLEEENEGVEQADDTSENFADLDLDPYPSEAPVSNNKKSGSTRKKRSIVWNYFRRIDSGHAECMKCKSVFSTPTGSTTGCLAHMRTKCLGHVLSTEAERAETEVAPEEALSSSPAKPRYLRQKRSKVWAYFDSTDDPGVNVCKLCGKNIANLRGGTSNMIVHLRNYHEEQFKELVGQMKDKTSSLFRVDYESRQCAVCSKLFSTKHAMLLHRQSVHSDEKPFKCDKCGMQFSRADSLKSHARCANRTYLCSICGKTFARKSIRDVHERSHHAIKPFKCSFCEKKFPSNQRRIHHERIHTGEKPFQCTDCGKQFVKKCQLTAHYRIHSGVKPYNCQHCSQMFRHISSRNNHKCEGRM